MAGNNRSKGNTTESLRNLKHVQDKGIHLTTEQRDRALEALATINFGAAAAHQLMGDAVDAANMHEAGAYCTAVEAIAKVTCRSCDVLAALLGDPGFGSFRAEFEVDRA
jgi:hypothetical protein